MQANEKPHLEGIPHPTGQSYQFVLQGECGDVVIRGVNTRVCVSRHQGLVLPVLVRNRERQNLVIERRHRQLAGASLAILMFASHIAKKVFHVSMVVKYRGDQPKYGLH
jgi:hypothetical protein